MDYFTTSAAAHTWAQSYGMTCSYRVLPTNGLFLVVWNYRGPANS